MHQRRDPPRGSRYNPGMAEDPQEGNSRGFATTQWSAVLLAGHESSPDAGAALAGLCETYWYPLYAYVRRRGHDMNDAQDLTQEFFSLLMDRNYVAAARPERGRFRSFLLVSFKHFLSKERDRANAQKRGGHRLTISLDLASGESRYLGTSTSSLTAEQLYERQWALALLDRVMHRLALEMDEAGRSDWFDKLRGLIAGNTEEGTYAEVAKLIGTSEAAVKMAAHRMRKRYRELLRLEIGETVEHLAEVEDEIRELFASLSG